jgi:DNA-binding transcriptional regulator PaaX
MDVNYDKLVSEVLDSMGLINLPSPEDRWVELPDLIADGRKRGRTDTQIRAAADRAVEAGTHERQKHGRRIFYREIKRDG